ncbi:carboxymuconolactone decarboxylase family protein [Effusibacillus dendaii]|uniref:Carboxymuconolactone decarboxylase-like domain-containing protein n=1 Tax=Effusibacillus dendaii TaxID=2743772 RepID=A0A7I8D4S0_9BACL|nr:hypothetical protein [Effusibacillus dendaii]BCJ85057.1 hypothetical protein skT53_00420 [Effusibacillus dendaii]
MTRIPGVTPEQAEGFVREVFEKQLAQFGEVLENHKLYARRPSIFKAVRGMWGALDKSGLIDAPLQTLINIRVASINECPF